MILFLNLFFGIASTIILGSGLYFSLQKDKPSIFAKAVFSWIILFVLYATIRPSYLPKGGVYKAEDVVIEPKNLEIQDRNRKPEKDTEEREKHYQETFSFKDEVNSVLNSPSDKK